MGKKMGKENKSLWHSAPDVSSAVAISGVQWWISMAEVCKNRMLSHRQWCTFLRCTFLNLTRTFLGMGCSSFKWLPKGSRPGCTGHSKVKQTQEKCSTYSIPLNNYLFQKHVCVWIHFGVNDGIQMKGWMIDDDNVRVSHECCMVVFFHRY